MQNTSNHFYTNKNIEIPRYSYLFTTEIGRMYKYTKNSKVMGQHNKKAQLSLTNTRDAVKIRVTGHSRASKVTPFDSFQSPMVSYYRPMGNFICNLGQCGS